MARRGAGTHASSARSLLRIADWRMERADRPMDGGCASRDSMCDAFDLRGAPGLLAAARTRDSNKVRKERAPAAHDGLANEEASDWDSGANVEERAMRLSN
jgi:hypothetical protein